MRQKMETKDHKNLIGAIVLIIGAVILLALAFVNGQ